MSGGKTGATRASQRRRLAVGGMAFLTGLFAAQPAAAYLPQSLYGWHWARTGKLMIQLGDNVDPTWDPYVKAAADRWSAGLPNIDFYEQPGLTTPSTCGAVFGTVQVRNGNYGATGWLGYAYLWVSGSFIVQATVKLNEYYFSQPQYNTAAWRQLVACQEIGHTLGLGHIDTSRTNLNLGTCMDYTADPTGTKGSNGTLANTAPSAVDFTNLGAIYANLDSTQLALTKPSHYGFAFEVGADSGGDDGALPMPTPVPEPAVWAFLLAGFGLTGLAARQRNRGLAC